MPRVLLPLSITYQTEGVTPLADVIAALRATDALIQEAVSLLPSVVDGLAVESSSVSVRALSQESPLREAFFVALLLTYQDELGAEVPPMLEGLLNVEISDRYDTLVTVLFLIAIFYGANLAVELVGKAVENQRPKQVLADLVRDLSATTGKPEAELRRIVEARFAEAKPMRKLIGNAMRWFLPSHREGNAPVMVDRALIGSDVVREVPPSDALDKPSDFDRYASHNSVELELHAMDKDRGGTGWAAVAKGISDRRLRMKVIEPLTPADLWGRDRIIADVVVVSRLTAHGYMPAEIHLTAIVR